jgi:hypothetical protein
MSGIFSCKNKQFCNELTPVFGVFLVRKTQFYFIDNVEQDIFSNLFAKKASKRLIDQL